MSIPGEAPRRWLWFCVATLCLSTVAMLAIGVAAILGDQAVGFGYLGIAATSVVPLALLWAKRKT